MSPQQTLAQRVRAKYPGAYDDIPDQELEASVRAKFPGVYDDIPTTQPKAPASVPSGPQHPYARLTQSLGDVLIGALKGGGETAINLGQMLHTIPGVSSIVDKLYGEEGLSERSFPAARAEMAPTNTAQRIGKGAEQMAEVMGGAGMVSSGVQKVLPQVVPRLARRIAGEATAGAMMGGVQGGDPITGAVIGGAGPVIGAGVRGARNMIAGGRNAPVVREAVEFGLQRGIPVDAATATGNPAVRAIQGTVDASPLGSFVGTAAKSQADDALTRTGRQLASEVSPSPQTMESAGAALQGRLGDLVRKSSKAADDAYERLRAIEARTPVTVPVGTSTTLTKAGIPKVKPIMGTVPMAVDLSAPKAALRPVYERLLRGSQIAQPMGAEAKALKALDRLMNVEGSYAPLSTVDDALGALKSVLRNAPDQLGPGAGTLRKTVAELDKAVQTAAMKAGPDAVRALREGRAATVKKYAVQDALDALGTEPVKAAGRAVMRDDAAITQLRTLAKIAPEELPKIGRAYVDDILEKATVEGGFQHTDALFTKWSQLGDETKALLFKPEVAKNFDKFFLLAKRMGENVNPSGSAKMAITAGTTFGPLGMMFTNPATGAAMLLAPPVISKLLHSPKTAELLTRSMTTPPRSQQWPGIAQQLMRLGAVQASQAGQR